MSTPSADTAPQPLPERPSLGHLKSQAKRRLGDLRATDPAAKLADAQLFIARTYGFASWRALKAFVDQALACAPSQDWPGYYRHDPRLVANAAVAIARDEKGLWFEAATGGRFELIDQGDGRAVLSGVDGHFEVEAAGHRTKAALVRHTATRSIRLERIDAATATTTRAAAQAAQADQAKPRTEVHVPRNLLERYTGHYASPLGMALRVDVRDGQLWVQIAGQSAVEVLPESETKFFFRHVPAQFSFLLSGDCAEAVFLHQDGIEQRMDRVTAEAAEQASAGTRAKLAEQQRPRVGIEIDPALLEPYAGRYRVGAERVLDVTVEDGRLFVEITGQERYQVYPESETRFFWTVVAAQISFMAGRSGAITHAMLHQNGRDMRLPRLSDDGDPA